MRFLKVLLPLVGALLSGVLMALVFEPFRLTSLVFIALIPLLLALWKMERKRSCWKGFGLGWLAGFAFFVINLKWLNTVAWAGALILPAYLALYWAAFGAFAATWGNPFRSGQSPTVGRQITIAFSNAFVWGGLEWLRGWLLTGFGWNGLGVGLHDKLVFAQAADLFGVCGLSVVLVFIQSVVGPMLLSPIQLRVRIRLWSVAVLSLLALAGYGILRTSMMKRSESEALSLTALLVQINAPQEAGRVLWDRVKVHLAYEDETLKGLKDKGAADLVIWPESALSGRLLRMDDGSWTMHVENFETIQRVREGGKFTMIQGMTELEGENVAGQPVEKDNSRIWNSLVVMSPEDQLQSFQKHHLVIFGETIPFVNEIPFLKKIYEEQSGTEYTGSFAEGQKLDPLTVELKGTKIGLIPSVCFEDTVPRLERKFVRPGPQVIVNVTNDGWFKESEAAKQHFSNALFRAIELRRPMLRCANTGVSGAVSMTGEVLSTLVDEKGSHFTNGSLLARIQVPLDPPFSLYALLGDWPIIGFGLIGLGMGWLNRKRPISDLSERVAA
jgi:apolipoprotein N-acyltransferase